jgi:putative flavoprotein involved in K+ transport
MTPWPKPIVIIGAGQSGLVATRAVRNAGLTPLVLEASDRTAGSWPHYYDSLTAFSPASYSSLPGTAFPGDPDHYPTRDEVVEYLEHYAEGIDAEIRTNTRVVRVDRDGPGFRVHASSGEAIRASGVVAATGSFANPYLPPVAGRETFTGDLLHVRSYREPKAYRDKRVIVAGGGNSAIQVGHELAEHARVTLATLDPIRFLAQRPRGRDIHYWTRQSGFDALPPAWLAQLIRGPLVSDDGTYSAALEHGDYDRRPMFQALDGDRVIWPDNTSEHVDVVIFATGYRPNFDYLRALGALDEHGVPIHEGGISLTHPGLVYLGIEFQRSFSSNTLRGVGRDADYVIPPLAAYASNALGAVGL